MSQKTEVVITARDDTRAAIASAQRGLQSLSAAGTRLSASFASIGVGGGLLGLVGGASVLATVKSAVDSLDALNDSVERLGVSAEDLSALNFAGKMNGLEVEDMSTALTKLSVKMKDAADGGKESGKLFEALGIKVVDTSGRLKSADVVFAEIAEAFAGMEDGAGKTAIAVEAFGKSGAKLVPVLNGGADGLKKMREEAGQLGAIMDGKLVKQAAEFNDNMDRLKTLSEAAGIAIASGLLPWLNEVAASFLIAQKHSDGFLDSLSLKMPGLQSVNVSKELKTLRGELEGLEKDRQRWIANGNSTTDGSTKIDSMIAGKKRQLEYYKELQRVDALAGSEGNYSNEGRGKTASTAKKAAPSLGDPEKPPKTPGSGSAKSQADDAARLLQSLREQIAIKQIDLESTDKLTGAEKEAAKVKYQLESGILKATDAQRAEIFARLDSLSGLEKSLAAQEEYRKALEGQEAANLKGRQAMFEQIAGAERLAETYGLAESAISAMTEARLEDAIATAQQNGASEDAIATLEEELALRQRVTKALEGSDLSRLLSNTESAKNKKLDAERATLDRALAAGKISAKEHEEALAGLKGEASELGEFFKQGARNAQDAMAEFFINPTKDGIQSMGKTFSETLQKMIAQAGSAQLFKLMLGDKFDKTGELGGVLGDLLKEFKGGAGKTGGGTAAVGAGATGAMATAFADMNKLTTEMQDSMSEMVAEISDGLTSMMDGLSDAMSSVDWGGMFGSLVSAFGFHSGGLVGSSGAASFTRSVPASLFLNAPRFHNGGLVGDEVPAILKPGELVLTKEQQRGMSGGGQSVNQILNFYGPAEPAQVKRAAAAGARQVTGLSAASARYT